MSSEAPLRTGVRVRCGLGGFAPCIDDLCHGGSSTMCGLEWYEDFCEHGYIPDTCPWCYGEDDENEDGYGDDALWDAQDGGAAAAGRG